MSSVVKVENKNSQQSANSSLVNNDDDEVKKRVGSSDSNDEKKHAMKMLREMWVVELKKAAVDFDKVSMVLREKALMALFQTLEVFETNGGSVEAAMWLASVTWQKMSTGAAKTAATKAATERLWIGLENFRAAREKIRQALDWPVLLRETVTAMTPLEKDKNMLNRVETTVNLLLGCADARSREDEMLSVMLRARRVLEETSFLVVLPGIEASWTDVSKKTFIAAMREIIVRHDKNVQTAQASAVEAQAQEAPVAIATSYEMTKCYRCGMRGHIQKYCPAQQMLCFGCKQPGHLVRDCPAAASMSATQAAGVGGRGGHGGGRGGTWRGGRGGGRGGGRSNRVAVAVTSENPSIFDYSTEAYSESSFFVGVMSEKFQQESGAAPLVVRILARGTPDATPLECEMLVDTGAEPAVIDEAFAQRIGALIRASRTSNIRGVGGTITPVVGEATFGVTLGGREFAVTALVAQTAMFDCLLGMRGMRAQNIAPVQIELSTSGGRVRMAGSEWVKAVDWQSPALGAEPVMLCNESSEWKTPASTVFMLIEGVGVFEAQFELGEEEGLSVHDVLSMAGFAEKPPVVTSTLEHRVKEALRELATDDEAVRAGRAWTMPNLEPTDSIVPPGPALQGSDREAWKSVSIGTDLPAEVQLRVRALCEEYKDVLGGSKKDDASRAPPMNKKKRAIKLVLHPNANLDQVAARVHRMSPTDAAFLEEFALQMEKEGRLRRETNAPATSLALVVKKENGSRRVVVNFGPLNQTLLSNHFPLPRIDESLNRLAKGEFHSSFDCWLCFHQFGISKESIPLTATWFSPSLLLSWLVAPMGIKTIPAAVQSVMAAEFNDERTIVYIDDIMQVIQTAEEVVAATKHVFDVCREGGWTLNAAKCRIGYRKLEMLGKIVGNGTIEVKPAYLEGIRNYGKPKNMRQLRRFNGLVTAILKHLPTAATTLRPLYEATGGGSQGEIVWSKEMDAAFEAALALIPQVVVPFDEKRPLLLLTDWSLEGGAGAFAHLSRDGNRFEIIDTFAHSNTSAERERATADGELSMVRLALKEFPHLMIGRRVHWITDSKTMTTALEAYRSSKNPRIRRMVAELQHVDMVVIDTPGSKHTIADALSRNPSFGVASSSQSAASVANDNEIAALVAYAVVMSFEGVDYEVVDDSDDDDEAGGAGARLGVDYDVVDDSDDDDAGGAGGAPRAPPSIASMFDSASEEERKEVEGFRLHGPEVGLEQKQESRFRWAARTADDPDLADLRVLAAANDAILASGGELVVPDDRKSLAAMMPRHDQFGILYVKIGGEGPLRAVVPEGCVSEAVDALHAGSQIDQAGAAHWHPKRVLATARRWLWWRTMYQDIFKWCEQCIACQRLRQLATRPPANLGDSEKLHAPTRLSDWQLDSYFLEECRFFSAIECYSGMIVVGQVPDATSAAFTAAFERLVVMPFGVPKRVWVDGGSEMKSHFLDVCLARNIELIAGQPYNPQSQARVERSHRTLTAAFAKAKAEGSSASVEQLLQRVAHEMNIAPSDLNDGLSPHRLMFALEPEVPFLRFLQPDLPDARGNSPIVHLKAQVEELVRAHDALALIREKDRVARRARHEAAVEGSHASAVQLAPGDMVWANPPPHAETKKLARHLQWSGPWKVLTYDDQSGRVEIEYESDNAVRIKAAVHVRNTRPFKAPRPLEERHWLDESVFPKGWETFTWPLGGMGMMPKNVEKELTRIVARAAKQRPQSMFNADSEAPDSSASKVVEVIPPKTDDDDDDDDEDDDKDDDDDDDNDNDDDDDDSDEQPMKEEILQVELGRRNRERVKVRRAGGAEEWIDAETAKGDPILKPLLEKFQTGGRQPRQGRRRARDGVG